MKAGKNPNFEQKKLLGNNGKDWTEWLLVKTTADSYIFRHKSTNEVITIDKITKKGG